MLFKQTGPLLEIFERMDGLVVEVRTYLSELVWHRLGKIKPMLAAALDIEVPAIENIMTHIQRRHDIVHRAGRTTEGDLIQVSGDGLAELRAAVTTFVDGLEEKLAARFPRPEPLGGIVDF